VPGGKGGGRGEREGVGGRGQWGRALKGKAFVTARPWPTHCLQTLKQMRAHTRPAEARAHLPYVHCRRYAASIPVYSPPIIPFRCTILATASPKPLYCLAPPDPPSTCATRGQHQGSWGHLAFPPLYSFSACADRSKAWRNHVRNTRRVSGGPPGPESFTSTPSARVHAHECRSATCICTRTTSRGWQHVAAPMPGQRLQASLSLCQQSHARPPEA